jgi:hypothetical protein
MIFVLSFSGHVSAQQPADEPITLPDSVMAQVVSRILRWYFKPASRPKSVLIAERGIKREWLPAISNINFRLGTDNDALKTAKGAFIFEGLERVGQHYSINVGWADFECDAGGDVWEFRTGRDNKVRLWKTNGGWGGGCNGNGPPTLRGIKLGEVSPNEMPGYEFFAKGKLNPIRLGISTKDDVRRIFGGACESACDYDENWLLRADYYEDRVMFTQTSGDSKETEVKTEYIPKPRFVGKLQKLHLMPKKRTSFLNVYFPRTFGKNQSYLIGDAWDEGGFAGAVHTTFTLYVDGYGLEYSMFGAETFNNSRKKAPVEKDPVRKGDLGEIEYSIPDSFKDEIFSRRVKPPEKQ